MLRLSGTLVSRILCSGYGMSAAQVADVIRQRVDPLDVVADAVPPAVCREVPALAPEGRDRPRHPSMQRAETEHRDELTMIETNSDLENTKQRLVEAADALRRLTMNAIKPSGLRSQWPDVILRVEEAYGWTEGRVRPPRPSPAEITRMDEAIGWLLWLNPDQRKVVWARSMRLSWRRIEDMDGRSVRTLQNIHLAALQSISSRRARESACYCVNNFSS
jgi:Domain of unknown function (DUF6362)